MRVALLYADQAETFEENLNETLEHLEHEFEVIDIKYNETGRSFSALILYRPQLIREVEPK